MKVDPRAVFLNIPYDSKFERLYLAYIAGIVVFGLKPKIALEVPGGVGGLTRIVELIRRCRFSFHDLSRTETDVRRPRTPRFNMPVECGMAIMLHALGHDHTWCLFEKDFRRVRKSTSDLAGTDVYTHSGTVKGVLREIGNALVHVEKRPDFAASLAMYRSLQNSLPLIMNRAGSNTLYSARVFSDLVTTATIAAKQIVT